MKEILLFAGTTEGRRLSECLQEAGIPHTICVATPYGEIILKEHPLVTIHRGRMDAQEIRAFLEKGDFAAVVDATHPYATLVTENIRCATEGLTLPCYRLKRETDGEQRFDKLTYFDSNEACATALEKVEGNILLTTGSKELHCYTASETLRSRLYVRVLPGMESIALCMEQGISGKQILALQGPFTTELNEAMLHQYKISCLVTKESGISGGYAEKIQAAGRANIPVFVIAKPKTENAGAKNAEIKNAEIKNAEIKNTGTDNTGTDNTGTDNTGIDNTGTQNCGMEQELTFREVCSELEKLCGCTIETSGRLEIILAGSGMGDAGNLTGAVAEAIAGADILLGAERLIAPYHPREEKKPYYQAAQILPYLKQISESSLLSGGKRVVILFSGDSGFYSGCQTLYKELSREVEEGGLNATLRILPGISSVSYFAACIGESYQDAAITSIHGKTQSKIKDRRETPQTAPWQRELAGVIRRKQKTFLLLSGASDVNALGRLLLEKDLADCEVVLGYQLSYPEQEITQLTPEECCRVEKEGLYICLIKNPSLHPRRLTHGISDQAFIRGAVPMTKEEVRQVSICKLGLHEKAVVYDVGSGTGSLAVEMAGLSESIQVFAIERKKEAISLMEQNREKFGVPNVTIVEGEAPEKLEQLPAATHAFLGGSGGKMREILAALYQKNPRMRIVINAVTIETVCEIREALSEYPLEQDEMVQLQVNRTRKMGDYHLMQAENPVWICAFNFVPK